MKTYTVAQVAEMLSVYPETVRRWIRSGKLKAVQTSRKGGNAISEESLREFLEKDNHAKYSREAEKTLKVPGALGMIAGASLLSAKSGLATSIVTGILSGAVKVMTSRKGGDDQSENVEYITNSIEQLKESISSKKLRVKQLQEEVEMLQREIAEEEQVLGCLENPDSQ